MRPRPWCFSALLLISCAGGDDEGSASASDPTNPTTQGTTSTASATGTTASTTATSTASTTTEGTTATTAGETTAAEPGAPFFISFSTNVGQITEGESVVFTAILSDPDGFDDIAGGTLFTEDGGFSYGPFVSAGQEGTYSITVSWAEIDQVAAIDFEDFELDRVFRAEFFDKDGNKVAQDTTITLRCDGGGACDGVCKDFQADDAHCGGCGVTCEGGCGDALCLPLLGECIVEADGFPTCDAYCQSVSEQCVVDGCNGATSVAFGDTIFCMNDSGATPQKGESCDFPQSWDLGRSVIRCCCSDTK